eukprot:scaffold1638_cov112-Skeletonema_dohrnii-CCMP3373.AAC.20
MSQDKGTESVASYSSITSRGTPLKITQRGIDFHLMMTACVHDGSFMPQLTSHVCSCAFVLYCSSTDKRAIGSFAEESANADNYIGEWLVSIGAFQFFCRSSPLCILAKFMTMTDQQNSIIPSSFEPSVEEASRLELSNYRAELSTPWEPHT